MHLHNFDIDTPSRLFHAVHCRYSIALILLTAFFAGGCHERRPVITVNSLSIRIEVNGTATFVDPELHGKYIEELKAYEKMSLLDRLIFGGSPQPPPSVSVPSERLRIALYDGEKILDEKPFMLGINEIILSGSGMDLSIKMKDDVAYYGLKIPVEPHSRYVMTLVPGVTVVKYTELINQ